MGLNVIRMLNLLALVGLSLVAGCSHTPLKNIPNIHSEARGKHTPTVVFINGNAATMSVWNEIESEIYSLGYRTFRADREGLGGSPLGARPYHISNELRAIEAAMLKQNVKGEKIVVAHSYGGLIAAMIAEKDPSVKGVVLVDALLPSELTSSYNTSILEEYRPQYDNVRKQAPALADAIIPVVEAFPETGQYLADTTWPNELRVITIRATQTKEPTVRKQISSTMHQNFVDGAPEYRELVLAEKSGHQVMSDEPELVIDSIKKLFTEP